MRALAVAPYASAALNFAAALALATALAPGTGVVADLNERIAYVESNLVAWRLGWSVWIAAALSLLAFYAWWALRVGLSRVPRVALAIAATGLAFDLVAEILLIGWLPDRYVEVAPLAFLMTGGVANGLYTIVGALLTLRTPAIRGAFAVWAWTMWASGAALSVFAFADAPLGIAVSTAVLFALFCPFCLALARRLA